MAKLVVKIKGQSEEFGLTNDARDIGGNDYLTISNGNKKQYARLGNNVTKLILRKNNQKFYVQKDPILFNEQQLEINDFNKDYVFNIYFPVGTFIIKEAFGGKFRITERGFFRVIVNMYSKDGSTYMFKASITNVNYGDVLPQKECTSKERKIRIMRAD